MELSEFLNFTDKCVTVSKVNSPHLSTNMRLLQRCVN